MEASATVSSVQEVDDNNANNDVMNKDRLENFEEEVKPTNLIIFEKFAADVTFLREASIYGRGLITYCVIK